MQVCHSISLCAWALAFVACDATEVSATGPAPSETSRAQPGAVHCNEPYGYRATPMSGAEGRASLYGATRGGLTKDPPLPRLAHGGTFWFFLETQADPDVQLTVEVSGDLRRTDESTGACWSYAGHASTHLQLVAGEEGQGTIEVLVDGAPYDRFELAIRKPASLAIEWHAETGRGRARLRDSAGDPLFAVRDITWEVAPTSAPALAEGPDGPYLTWDGNIDEVLYLAFFGDLSASVSLVVDPATGLFRPRTKR